MNFEIELLTRVRRHIAQARSLMDESGLMNKEYLCRLLDGALREADGGIRQNEQASPEPGETLI